MPPFRKKISINFLEDYLINLCKKGITYVNNTQINILNNKTDGTSLSSADLHLDKLLSSSLIDLDNNIPVVSEEKKILKEAFMEKIYWLIDPIDGTSNYINGGKEYTINIALIENGTPTIGVIAHPPSQKIWFALRKKLFIFDVISNNKKKVKKINMNINSPTIIISKEKNKKTEKFVNNIKNKKIKYISSSLKFCHLASQKAILYPRFSVIKKWDIAAGHAILKASGGEIIKLNGKEYKYNYPSEFACEFIAYGLKTWKNILNFKKPLEGNFF